MVSVTVIMVPLLLDRCWCCDAVMVLSWCRYCVIVLLKCNGAVEGLVCVRVQCGGPCDVKLDEKKKTQRSWSGGAQPSLKQ